MGGALDRSIHGKSRAIDDLGGAPTSISSDLQALLARLADRDRPRSEATLQADIRQLLLLGDFGLAEDQIDVELEAPAGGGRRIDVEVGFTVIEVKKSLGSPSAIRRAEQQLAGYVRARSQVSNQLFVGVLTDGARWSAYHLIDDELVEVTNHVLSPGRPNGLALFFWLEGVLATRQGVRPTPTEIVQRLGATSTSHMLDRAALAALYREHAAEPTVRLKRRLWAQLLRSALGTQFVDQDDLFIEHTLLMNSADIIAHLVVGFDVLDMQPASMLSGERFTEAGIHGVVEQDFFDWTIEVPRGAEFVRTLSRRLARFNWSHVEHDVLKVLYESIIGSETRKRMGEYYTPDWLAEQIAEATIDRPLEQRVLDPACGSGTFLFHAVRRYLSTAEAAGQPTKQALRDVGRHVMGVDLHPVAVSLARVTYLLAIGRDRLRLETRGPIAVPVYLGDSMQWRQQLDLFTEGNLKISAGTGDGMVEQHLRFPNELLNNAGDFDRLVAVLASLATKPPERRTASSLNAVFHQLGTAEKFRPMIRETFGVMCRLHDEGEDHIWSYYIRNLARPVWLALDDNRVDVLIGNPPWLSYRNMPSDMQSVFRRLSQDRGLWHGRGVATHQDLSALFVARTIQQYLAFGGCFGFVMPNSVLDRNYFDGFRSGWYEDPVEPTAVTFSTPWDLRRIRPHPFPRGACVIFGQRAASVDYRRLPASAETWSGHLPAKANSWQSVATHITRRQAQVADGKPLKAKSGYKPRFMQGATIVPRMLFFVDAQPAGPLGLGAGRRAVRSARSSTEKAPWKNLPRLAGIVETEFIRHILLGESVIPYRLLEPREAVLPLVGTALLDGLDPILDHYPGLADWWRDAENVWSENRSSERLTLIERLNFRRGLTSQLPAPSLRVVYGKAGMHVAAAIVDSPRAIMDHKLYWGAVATRDEGNFLCAILNSPILTELVRPMMSYGKDERDIDKHLWELPIPLYDSTNLEHRRLAMFGQQQADTVASLDLDQHANFVALRRRTRQELAKRPAAGEIATLLEGMLGAQRASKLAR